MTIKHSITFRLRPIGSGPASWSVQMDVTFNRHRLRESTGFVLDRHDAWDFDRRLAHPEYRGRDGQTGEAINYSLINQRLRMEAAFCRFERDGVMPDPAGLLAEYRRGEDAKKEKAPSGTRVRIVVDDVPRRLDGTAAGEWLRREGYEFDVTLPFVPAVGEPLKVTTPDGDAVLLDVAHREIDVDLRNGDALARLYVGVAQYVGTETVTTPDPQDDALAAKLGEDLRSLGLPVWAYNCLRAFGIEDVGTLCACSAKELGLMRGFGTACVTEVEARLAERGLRLAMDVGRYGYAKPEWMGKE